jgi:hypothetical protein
MQCMFYPAISSAFVTSLPQHVKVMSKKWSTNEAIVLHSDNDNDNKDDLHRNSKNTKFGKQKHNMEAANKEYFMKAVCSIMVSMLLSYAKRNNRKEHKEEIKELQTSVARLQELEHKHHTDIANCTDSAHKGLLIDSLKLLKESLKKQDEELEMEKSNYKKFDEHDPVQEFEWGNSITLAADRLQHNLRKKLANQSSYTSKSNSVQTTVTFSNTKSVAHVPKVAASDLSDNGCFCNNFLYKTDKSTIGPEKEVPDKVVILDSRYDPSQYEESMDLLASPQPAKNDKTFSASKNLFAAKESIDLLASTTQDD